MTTVQMDFKKNGLDFVRYYAAISVMLLHFSSYYIYYSDLNGIENSMVTSMTVLRRIALAVPGVVVFFSLSGFLAMASLERGGGALLFLKRKFFRLFPQLYMGTVINIVILAIVVPFMLDRSIIWWALSQLIGLANTPSCVKDFATGSINGALWTIFVQIQFFILIALTAPLLKKLKVWGWSIVLVLTVFCNVFAGFITDRSGNEFVNKLVERMLVPYLLWFMLGAFVYAFREVLLPVLKRWWPIGLIALILVQLGIIPDYGYYTGVITGTITPITVIGIGYALPKKRLFDITYEMFLTHWIILNLIIHFNMFETVGCLGSLVIFIGATILLSLLLKMAARPIDMLRARKQGE